MPLSRVRVPLKEVMKREGIRKKECLKRKKVEKRDHLFGTYKKFSGKLKL